MPFCCGKRSAGICAVLGPKTSSPYSTEYALRSFRSCGLASASTPFSRNEGLLGQTPDMDELVKIPLVAGPLMCDVAHPWKARDLKAKRDATVNQPDIRVLPTQGWTGTHDADSSGAASI
jgi:hypothetical protein